MAGSASVQVMPTLATMAGVYRLPRDGGAQSQRFRAYLRLVDDRRDGVFQAFNPMAGERALATVEALLAIGAEDVAARAAAEARERCAVAAPLELAIVVCSPGMWTDRLVTEAEHRLRAERGRPAHVQLWAGEPVDGEGVAAAAAAEAIRAAWEELHGPAASVADALAREGLALALAGERVEPLAPGERAAASEALAVLGASSERSDVLAVAYGDPIAEALGWRPPGVPDRGGCRLAAELARERAAALGPAGALRAGAGWLAGASA